MDQYAQILIPISEPLIGKRERQYVLAALEAGEVSSRGRYVREFEERFAHYVGTRYAVSTCNGTAALHLALAALDVGQGDEVIVPTLTFVATANAVVYTGARPIFVDAHPDYWCLNEDKIQEKITSSTKGIIAVHLYGHPAEMDRILAIARRYRLWVIEDAAEAHGAEYRGRKVGSIGDLGVFSFYGNKIITTGEGGILVTSNEEIAKRARLLRDHGMDPNRKYWHPVIGFNYRMANLQAALGLAQLEKLDDFVDRKRSIAQTYRFLLENVEGLSLQIEKPWAKSVFWMFSILLDKERGLNRDFIMEGLLRCGIETRPFFHPLHSLPPYGGGQTRLPVAESLGRLGINLPSGVGLTQEQVKKVVETLMKLVERKA